MPMKFENIDLVDALRRISPICIALLEASVAFVTAELTAMHMTMTIIPSSIAIAIMGRTVRTIAGTMSRMRSMRG